MSSNQPVPGIVATKSSTPAQPATPSQPAASSSGNDTQRRGGGSGQTSGAAVIARGNLAAPRNNQSARRGHKNHRKPNTPRDGIDEQIAMTSSSNRKGTSITHLMNWNVTTRSHATTEYRHRSARRNPTWGLGSGYHAIDKARYVNANYRFIVNPCGDYRAQAVDSDVHLPWDHVLQVLASEQTQCTNCPICLCTPVAPRMAKCGHIFCLPCLLRYMAVTDGKASAEKKPRYKKCVICTDSVYLADTRPVRFFAGQEGETPREGQDVVLRLVGRRQGSTLALPRDGADTPEKLEEIPWYFAAEVMDYARIMKGTEEYMVEQYTREIEELEMMEREDELIFGDDGVGTRKAVAMIKIHMESIKGMGNPPKLASEPLKQGKKRPEIVFNEDDSEVPLMYQLRHEAHSGRSSSSQISLQDSESSSQASSSQSKQASISSPYTLSSSTPVPAVSSASGEHLHDSPYYFYQALLHYYLSSLDIRILKAAFGAYSSFPSTILPRVENVTGHLVDDDLRKRAKYLAHLPAGCEVGFLECDWTDIVPAEILEHFKPEIDRRRKRKKDKEIKEERDRMRAERVEDEQRWAAAKLRRSTGREEFSDEDFVALATAQSLADASSSASVAVTYQSFPENSGGSTAHTPSPVVGSSSYQKTVWGTPAVAPMNKVYKSEDEEWAQDWDARLEEELARLEDVDVSGGRAPSGGKGQKKRKFKKVTLMTNGGQRGA